MSDNQLHGIEFETAVRRVLKLPEPVSATDIFDHGHPLIATSKIAGSIKATQKETNASGSSDATIYLSDASRVWAWGDLLDMHAMEVNDKISSIHLLLGLYTQKENVKLVSEVYDIKISLSDEMKEVLYGKIQLAEICAFHLGLRREFFPNAEDARVWAENINAKLSRKGGIIKLHQKIDSKTQRRLQCSVKLSSLLRCIPDEAINRETKNYHGLELPYIIESSARNRNRKKQDELAGIIV